MNDEYEVDPYYGDPYEPYFEDEDQGYGTCGECGSFLQNWGAHSDGDGDFYDLLGCPLCQEERGRTNQSWLGLDGEAYPTEEEMWAADAVFQEGGDELDEE